MASDSPYLTVPVIRVEQPLGPFYVTRLPARHIKALTHVTALQIVEPEGDTYTLAGSQRKEQTQRRGEIADFIRTDEAAFPNTIILGANYDEEGNFVEDADRRWRIVTSNGGFEHLEIPRKEPLAAVIDGQHRLLGFDEVDEEFLSIELPCSIYLDLPTPYQAYVFAVINFNQRKVDKSLAYEMFAFDATSRSPETWSPETLAVHLCRKLNVDDASPFYEHIKLAPQNDHVLFDVDDHPVKWRISTATVVEGILKLISSNPKRDKSEMNRVRSEAGRRRSVLSSRPDSSPLRSLFVAVNDKAIYTAVVNFFTVVNAKLWQRASSSSYIYRTVGIQALFDVLKHCLKGFDEQRDLRQETFGVTIEAAEGIDFSDDFFQASGVGRTRIKNCILLASRQVTLESLSASDRGSYSRVVGDTTREPD